MRSRQHKYTRGLHEGEMASRGEKKLIKRSSHEGFNYSSSGQPQHKKELNRL